MITKRKCIWCGEEIHCQRSTKQTCDGYHAVAFWRFKQKYDLSTQDAVAILNELIKTHSHPNNNYKYNDDNEDELLRNQ